MVAIDAIVETPCLLRMLFQILNAIIFVLENQGLGENVEAATGGMFMLSPPSVTIVAVDYFYFVAIIY